MSTNPLILKNPKGWFAAGSEVQKALTILSDGAFKLFVHICLHARRDTGVMETSQTDLARTLKKAHGTVRSYLREMESAGVCQTKFSRNPFARGVIQIAEAFWPYQNPEGKTVPQPGSDAFVGQVREMLEARACVRSSFSVADEILARQWFARGVPIEQVEQAILLACARKYMSWRNGQTHAAIACLAYFEPVLDEIQRQTIHPEYWGYVRFKMQRMEALWKEAHARPRLSEEEPA